MKKEALRINVAAISDRGLSEKRPVNEDSYLADINSRMFVVADGVGGADAGEVASQTAVQIVSDSFREQSNETDFEDLMELAIQRANHSIYQMTSGRHHMSSMATTIVALHIDGKDATLGHVGDSRIYRLTPDGHLSRETEDHSLVEEEVRAGRLTPEQAAIHPNRNIISRALGVEATVEVDLKRLEVSNGTQFLLCSDGITRHISDSEIEGILKLPASADQKCAEMKKRCFERGAEDNLTAVVVEVGDPPRHFKPVERQEEVTGSWQKPATSHSPSRMSISVPVNSTPAPAPKRAERSKKLLIPVLALLVLTAGAGFFVGLFYEKSVSSSRIEMAAATHEAQAQEFKYESMRRDVDKAPAEMALKLGNELNGKTDSADPKTLYLYGRALMLSGRPEEAKEIFKHTITKLDEQNIPKNDPLNVDTALSSAAAGFKANDKVFLESVSKRIDDLISQSNAGTIR
jgi:serine/threonine protein phosphatase PrpC